MNCILHPNIFIYLLDWNFNIVDWIRTCLSTKSPNLTFWKTDYPGSFFNSLMVRSQRHRWIKKLFRKIILHFIRSRSACHIFMRSITVLVWKNHISDMHYLKINLLTSFESNYIIKYWMALTWFLHRRAGVYRFKYYIWGLRQWHLRRTI
jgi:hypothetical protein